MASADQNTRDMFRSLARRQPTKQQAATTARDVLAPPAARPARHEPKQKGYPTHSPPPVDHSKDKIELKTAPAAILGGGAGGTGEPTAARRDDRNILSNLIEPVAGPVEDWLNAPAPRPEKILSGTIDEPDERFGGNRIRSGVSDPAALSGYQLSGGPSSASYEPTPILERLFIDDAPYEGPSISSAMNLVMDDDAQLERKVQTLSTLSEVINDANLRLGGARKWTVDDPFDSDDDPQFEYTMPSGKKFLGPKGDDPGDTITYWRLKDGTVISEDEIPSTASSDGTVVLRGSGRKIPIEWLRFTEKDYSHTAFPDGTVFARADGSIPEEILSLPKREHGRHKPGWGVADPRAPWQNTAGKNFWEGDFWEGGVPEMIERSTLNEAPAFITDMLLNSAPYFIPNYGIASGVARANPYMNNFDGSSYMPEGRGFDELGKIGMGTYADNELTNGQKVGGMAAPIIDAIAERLAFGKKGGKSVGGMEGKIPGLAKTAVGGYLARHPLLSSVIGEGYEEVMSSPFQQLSQEGYADLGREYTIDDKGEKQFAPGSQRLQTMPENMFQDFLGGATMGFGMSGGPALMNQLYSKRVNTPSALNPRVAPKVNPDGTPFEDLDPNVDFGPLGIRFDEEND